MTAPRRTQALVRAQAHLDRVRLALAAHEPGVDPWQLAEAQQRYDAALSAALDPSLADGPAPEPRGPAGRVPRALRG